MKKITWMILADALIESVISVVSLFVLMAWVVAAISVFPKFTTLYFSIVTNDSWYALAIPTIIFLSFIGLVGYLGWRIQHVIYKFNPIASHIAKHNVLEEQVK